MSRAVAGSGDQGMKGRGWRGHLEDVSSCGEGGGPCPAAILDKLVPGPQAAHSAVSWAQAAASLQLNDAGLKFLESQRSPLFLVPALGVYRGGKSLLLNRLMRRQAPYSNSFGVGHGQQTFTRQGKWCEGMVVVVVGGGGWVVGVGGWW
eukprot:Skav211459  [mRNA]  locus=scaffold379:180143:182024:- [translate_table: standard]